jgi:hypothetical protein
MPAVMNRRSSRAVHQENHDRLKRYLESVDGVPGHGGVVNLRALALAAETRPLGSVKFLMTLGAWKLLEQAIAAKGFTPVPEDGSCA